MSYQSASLKIPYLESTPLLVLSLLVFDSLHFVFARLLLPYLPPTTSALYMMGVATLEVVLWMQLRGQIRWGVLVAQVRFFAAIGLLIAVSTILTFTAVAYIDPGTATLLSKSAIVFGVGLGMIWLRERLMPSQIVGVVVAISGVIIITFQPGDYWRLGSLIVLCSALLYALHNALFKRYGEQIDLGNFFLFRLGSTTFFLVLIGLLQSKLIAPPSWQAWFVLFLASTVNVVLSRALFYLALQRLTLSLHSIVMTLSPVVTIGWTLLLFGIWPTGQQLLGGGVVIVGVLMTLGQLRLPGVRSARVS